MTEQTTEPYEAFYDHVQRAVEDMNRQSQTTTKPPCKLCGGTGWQKVFDPKMMNTITVACRVCR